MTAVADHPAGLPVELHGEHDISTAPTLAAILAQAIELEEDGDVVADLSDVRFMDASTLTVLLRARDDLIARHRNLLLARPSPIASRLLEVCHLEGLLVPPSDLRPNGGP